MTHPHGLTRQDVAHLKAGDKVTFDAFLGGKRRRIIGEAYEVMGDTLWVACFALRLADGNPALSLVEVVSPKPPTPPMAEPTWLGAVVMTDEGSHVHVYDHDGRGALTWSWGEHTVEWEALANPRPLTDAERRDLGIPETLPEGWVGVDARDLQDELLRTWLWGDASRNSVRLAMLDAVARAELARREATA